MAVQTTYDAAPAIALAGMIATEGPRDVVSASAESACAPGTVCVRGASDRTCKPPLAATADVDAIIATGGSTAGVQTLSGGSLDGVVGGGAMSPTRNLTFTLSSHADWDATTITVTGVDIDGAVITEAFTVPNGGNATVTGASLFKKVTSVSIPAQSGTGGTFTMGFGALVGSLKGAALGVALYDATKAPGTYAQYDSVPLLRRGPIYVLPEATVVAGDPVWVRCVATGSEVLGALRPSPDANDCVLLEGARFGTAGTTTVPAVLELNLPR